MMAGAYLAKMVRLADHEAQPAHLPNHPLIDVDATPLGLAVELTSLTDAVLQHCPGFEGPD